MKYNIHLNQKQLYTHFKGITLEQACIFDVFQNLFAFNKGLHKIIVDNEVYVWVKWDLILNELPLLGDLSKATVIRKINALIELGLIKRVVRNNRGYYTAGDKVLLLFTDSSEDVDFIQALTDKEVSHYVGVLKLSNEYLYNTLVPIWKTERRRVEVWRARIKGCLKNTS